MNASFIQARITATQNMILAYESAIDALIACGAQEYIIDTGQNRQRVTKLDLPKMQTSLDALYNRCATLEARLNGSGVVTVGPSW